MRQPDLGKKTVLRLVQKKTRGEKITAVTAYDFPTASIAADALIDEKELDSLNAVIVNMKDGNEIEKITNTKL